VFNQTTGDISDHYLLQVTPAGWTFSIWGIIYTWQALWLIYGLTTICRKKDGTYFYLLPLMPVAVYFSFMFNNICNVAWLFTWDMEEMVAALPLIALMPFSLYIGLYFSFSSVYRNLAESTKKGLSRDIWLIRLLVQNGIAFYATWVTIATLLNLAIVMSYWGDVSVEDSGTTVLSILLVEVIIWFVTDIFIFDKYVRYTFSPYITLIMALSGVLSKNYDLDNTYRNSVFTLFNLVLCIILFVFKLVTLFWRHFRSPINPQMVIIIQQQTKEKIQYNETQEKIQYNDTDKITREQCQDQLANMELSLSLSDSFIKLPIMDKCSMFGLKY
ncbi:hypothetical protein KUTeg_015605, partial [Tegillarca granosa]